MVADLMEGSIMRMRAVLAVVAIGGVIPAGCEKQEPAPIASTAPEDEHVPVIYTTFYPTEYFVERIGGSFVQVVCPVPGSVDAIFWQPDGQTIQAYRDADMIIVNGAAYEKWIATASLPESRIVDTAAGFSDEFITFETTTHSHGAGGEHTHEGIDGHTWLDPNNAKRQAAAIRDALISRFGGHDDAYRQTYAALASDLDALDARFRAITPMLDGVELMASHPAYNYVAKRYGWEVHNHGLDPLSPIEPEALSEINVDDGSRVGVMLWESEPLTETVAALEGKGIRSVVFNPAELLGAQERAMGEDYLRVMNENLDRLERAVKGS